MNDEQYFLHLRQDTLFCEFNELIVSDSFLEILDTVILSKLNFKNCNSDPNPFVYMIYIENKGNKLSYKIETLFSTFHLDYLCDGAFQYKNEFFVVSGIDAFNSYFTLEEKHRKIIYPYCNRLYHSKFNYVTKIEDQEICIEYLKNETITIK